MLVHHFYSCAQPNLRVKVPRLQFPPAINGTMVGHLDDPGTCGALVRIEGSCFAVEKQEDVLKQVVCFAVIMQDSGGHRKYETSEPAEKDRERFPAPRCDLSQDNLIWRLADRLRDRGRDLLFSRRRYRGKTDCDGGVQNAGRSLF